MGYPFGEASRPLTLSEMEAMSKYPPPKETPTETDIRRMKLDQNWYDLKERIYRIRALVNQHSRFDFDQLIEDIRSETVQHTLAHSIKQNNMRSIEELKQEIDELNQVRLGVNTEIEVLNSQNKNAQAKRDRIIAKIDGLTWMLDENDIQEKA